MRTIRRPRRPGALRALMRALRAPARLLTHLLMGSSLRHPRLRTGRLGRRPAGLRPGPHPAVPVHWLRNNAAAVTARVGTRTGGHLVVESLEALGTDAVFGLPGVHVLPIWEAMRTSETRTYGFRTELNAGFAACGWAHVTARPAPLLLSTGPGALNSLTAVMEAASSHLPVVAIAGQVPTDLVGRGRGFLHELRDQRASFAPIVKWTAQAIKAADVPEMIAEAFRRSLTPPSGPCYVEVPFDLLAVVTSVPAPRGLDGEPATPTPPSA